MEAVKTIKGFERNYATGRMVLKDVLPLEVPLCISIEPTNVCNFKCVMCCHGDAKYTKALGVPKIMEWNLFEECIEQISAWCVGKRKIKLMKLYSLGEPLLNKQICEMVRVIKEADICDTLEITSNASLLTREVAEKLVDYGLDIFRASIYSVNEQRNFEITKSHCSTDQIAENIRYMVEYREKQKKTKPFVSAKMIDSYSGENEKFISKYAVIADEAYIDKMMVFDDNTLEDYYGDKAEDANADESRLKLGHKPKACRYPFTHMTVRSDGKVVVCCADWVQKTVIGDLHQNTLPEIWNSKKLYDFRCMMLKTKGTGNEWCRKCEIPLRSCEEDDIDEFPIDNLGYSE